MGAICLVALVVGFAPDSSKFNLPFISFLHYIYMVVNHTFLQLLLGMTDRGTAS